MIATKQYTFCPPDFLARLDRLHLVAKRVSQRHTAGARRSRRMGDGLEFADHRDYAPGDEPRFIDWPYYARMDKLLLRLFHEHSASDVGILLDCSGSMSPQVDMAVSRGARVAGVSPARNAGVLPARIDGAGAPAVARKFDYARCVAAAMSFIAMGSLQRVVLAAAGDGLGGVFHSGRNRSQIIPVMDFLETLDAGGKTDLLAAGRQFAARFPSCGTILLISDLLDCSDQLDAALAHLRQAGRDTSVLHVFSPSDADPPVSGSMLLEEPETAGRLGVLVTDELLAAYRAAWSDFQATCRRKCLSSGAMYVAAATSVPFDRLVLESLRKAGVVGE